MTKKGKLQEKGWKKPGGWRCKIHNCTKQLKIQLNFSHYNLQLIFLFVAVENIEGFQGSPYPEVDEFVLSLVNKNGIKGGKDNFILY